MNLEKTQDSFRNQLSVKAVTNNVDGARYEVRDIGKMNDQFDFQWSIHYGYHPDIASKYDDYFNRVEG